ncbi:unnamed protein product [Urochloa decumbens]|uniref:Uncharacterized protein n=1 Tax=Urochloa decumbens TaxID=240449 RepID=A0ABC9C1A4_9POAL
MEGILVSAATGALKPVLGKLAALLGDEYRRFKGLRGEVQFLVNELGAMNAFLVKMSEEENYDAQDKIWMEEVREMSYDIEDSLDDFMLHVSDKNTNQKGFIKKCKNMLMKAKTRSRVAKAIEDLKVQVKEVGDRNARYKIRESILKASNETVDHRALVIFEDASKLIGIDTPKQELIKLLANVDGLVQSYHHHVVSIVGVGGLGKTTLANQVYQELRGQFGCHAFVSVTRNPNIRNVLKNILYQVSYETYSNIEAWDIQLLISELIESIKGSRYLIVVDDIWKIEAWEIIKLALPKNGTNSKIITTTRLHDVAEACCSLDCDFVYKMKPLGYVDSKKLFLDRIFGCENKCPRHLMNVSHMIIEKCGGLPLAVISISGLLANKPQTEEQWDVVQKSIGRSLGKNPDVHRMMQILSLSYFDLPHHLKSCLLYLSIFPEDSIIDKRRLVRRWIVEGFIKEEQGHTLSELGERCFNELINRSLVQVRQANMYDEVTNCMVHDTILDFIIQKSEEENFVTVSSDDYQTICPDDKVRRLSLHGCSQKNVCMPNDLNLSHVRSITVTVTRFNYSVQLPLLSSFKYLRVLDLQGCRQVEDYHFADVGSLYQLKYLSLCETGVSVLPEQIGQLKYMETLDLQQTKIVELPASVVHLSRLVHLVFNRGVKVPAGCGRMAALQEIEHVDVFKQPIEFTKDIGQLTDLRKANMYMCYNDCKKIGLGGSQYKHYMDNIVNSLSKLGNLHSLSIDIDSTCAKDFSLDSVDFASLGFQKLYIQPGFIPKIPKWVRSKFSLKFLTIYVKEFEVDDIMALGHLPALEFVCVVAHESFEGRMLTIRGSEGFSRLRSFKFGCAIPVKFEDGAMPKLENLILMFSSLKTSQLVSKGDFSFGIQHLSSLKTVFCGIHLSWDAVRDWIAEKKTQMASMGSEAAMAAFSDIDTTALYVGMGTNAAMRREIFIHPKSPRLEIHGITQWKLKDTMPGSSSTSEPAEDSRLGHWPALTFKIPSRDTHLHDSIPCPFMKSIHQSDLG